MNTEHIFHIILIMLKITIVTFWVIDVYLKYAPVEYRFLDISNEQFWQKRISVLFEIFIAFFLIYLFNPFYAQKISKRTTLTLFIFGFLIIFRTDWAKFIGESMLIKLL